MTTGGPEGDTIRYDPLDREIIDAQNEYRLYKEGAAEVEKLIAELEQSAATLEEIETANAMKLILEDYKALVDIYYGIFRNLLYAKTGILP